MPGFDLQLTKKIIEQNKLLMEKVTHGILIDDDLDQFIDASQFAGLELEQSNIKILDRINKLNNILELSLQSTSKISFESLRRHDKFRDFSLPSDLSVPPKKKPQLEEFLSRVRKPSILDKIFPGSEKWYQEDLLEARESLSRGL